MNDSRFTRYGLSLLIGAVLSTAQLSASASEEITRDSAVALARQGNYPLAIEQLRALAKASTDRGVRDDLIVVLDWAGRDADAVSVWRQMGSPVDLPDYVRLALVDCLIDQKQWQGADRVVRHWLTQDPKSVDAQFFMGQVLQAKADRFGALRHYQTAQSLAPDNQKIRQHVIQTLIELGAVTVAQKLQTKASAQTDADVAAQRVRWGLQIPPAKPEQTYDRVDNAISQLQRLIDQEKLRRPADIALLRRLHADLAVALADRQRWADVMVQLDYLEQTGGIPGYVQVIRGDALLIKREPELAKQVFEEVLKSDPGNRQAQQGLLGALIELNEWQAAYALADRIEPNAGLRVARSPGMFANDAWLDARIQAVLVRLWADQSEMAWTLLQPLADRAPAEPDVQITTATVAKARGWPRLGEQHAKVAYQLAPQSKETQLALARAQMSRAQWREAKEALQKLQANYPWPDPEINELARDLRDQDLFELIIDLQAEDESGQSFYAPGDGYQTSAYLFSPRLNDRWRFYTAATAGRARTDGVFSATRQQLGVGAVFDWPDMQWDISVWSNLGSVHKTSFALQGVWEPTDHWRFEAGYNSFTNDMPLRALAYGVTANEASAGVTYVWSSAASLSAGYATQQFSDSNHRQRLVVTWQQQVYSAPQASVTLAPSFYTSSNSETAVEYFSPKRDWALNLAAQGERVIWRRYDRSFGDRLVVGAGNYWQQDYGSGWIAEVGYQQFYKVDHAWEVNYGLGWNRRIYDGDPERSWQVNMNLVVRF